LGAYGDRNIFLTEVLMTTNNKDYELHILKKIINNYLDEAVPFNEEGLTCLVAQQDEIVWNIATKIYSESGYKVEFSFIRDLINIRIELVKKRIAAEKAADHKRLELEKIEEAKLQEQAKIKEAKRAKRLAQQAKIEQEKRAEKARIEAKRLAEQAQISISDLFLKVQPLISKLLKVDLNEVNFKSHISRDFGADDIDQTELIIALEEEFEIEIPDDNGLLSTWPVLSHDDRVFHSCTVEELVNYIHQQISDKYFAYLASHPYLNQNNQ
jgi:acyl carrier protein